MLVDKVGKIIRSLFGWAYARMVLFLAAAFLVAGFLAVDFFAAVLVLAAEAFFVAGFFAVLVLVVTLLPLAAEPAASVLPGRHKGPVSSHSRLGRARALSRCPIVAWIPSKGLVAPSARCL